MYQSTEADPHAPHSRTFGRTSELGATGIAPSGYRVVEVDTPSSAQLRDLASLRRDIELAEVYLGAFAALDLDELVGSRDPRLALWHSAVVFYGRAFNQGVRRARLSIEELNEDEREFHQYLIDLRNKHVAHAVNEFEHTVVVAYLTDSSFARRAITRTGQAHIELLLADDDVTTPFANLCKRHIVQINRKIKDLHLQVRRELDALGLDAVYSFPESNAPEARRENVSKRRK